MALACSAPDPAEINVRKPPKQAPTRFDAGTAGGEGGSTGPSGVFAGAPPYVRTPGPTTLQLAHQQQAELGNQTNPAGKDCLRCHIEGGAAADGGPEKLWAIGGTVYTTKLGPPVDAGYEVRIKFPDGGAFSTYTDDQGNFFIKRTVMGPVPEGAQTGVRGPEIPNGLNMVTSLIANQGGCSTGNTCHGGAATGKIYVIAQ